MWKLRLLIVALAVLAAWGGTTALLLPEAVRRARVLETDAGLRRAAAGLPAAVRTLESGLMELARRAAEGPVRATRSLAEIDAAAVVASLAEWPEGGETDWALLSQDGVVLARSANTAKHGDSLSSEPIVRLAAEVRAAERLGLVDGAWRVAAAVPLEPLGEAPVRILLVSRPLGVGVARELGRQLGGSLALAAAGALLAAALPSKVSEAVAARLDEPPEYGRLFGLRSGEEAWRVIRQTRLDLDVWLLRRLPPAPSGVGDSLLLVGLTGWERWGRAGPLLLLLVCLAAGLLGAGLPVRTGSPLPGWRTPPAPPTDDE